MILYESEIEQSTLELLRDEGGGRGVWPLGCTAVGAYGNTPLPMHLLEFVKVYYP